VWIEDAVDALGKDCDRAIARSPRHKNRGGALNHVAVGAPTGEEALRLLNSINKNIFDLHNLLARAHRLPEKDMEAEEDDLEDLHAGEYIGDLE
jgi:hypothetical protein